MKNKIVFGLTLLTLASGSGFLNSGCSPLQIAAVSSLTTKLILKTDKNKNTDKFSYKYEQNHKKIQNYQDCVDNLATSINECYHWK